LGLVASVRRAAAGDVFPFWALSGLYFLQNGPYVLVGGLVVVLGAAGSQTAKATSEKVFIWLTSAFLSTLWQWVHSSWHGRREKV
jgi:hypothetical protein